MLNRNDLSQEVKLDSIDPDVTEVVNFIKDRVENIENYRITLLAEMKTEISENKKLANSIKPYLMKHNILTALVDGLFFINDITDHLQVPQDTGDYRNDTRQWNEFETKKTRVIELIYIIVQHENGKEALRSGYFDMAVILANSYFTLETMFSLLSAQGMYFWENKYVSRGLVDNHKIFCTDDAVTAFKEKLITFDDAMSIISECKSGPGVLKVLFSANGLRALRAKHILPATIKSNAYTLPQTIEVLVSDNGFNAFEQQRILPIQDKRQNVNPTQLTSYEIIQQKAFGGYNPNVNICKNLELFLLPISAQAIKDGVLVKQDFTLRTDLLIELITENGITALKNNYFTVNNIKESRLTKDILHQMLTKSGLIAFDKKVMTFIGVNKFIKNSAILEEMLTHGIGELITGNVTLQDVSLFSDKDVLHQMLTKNGRCARDSELITFERYFYCGFSVEVSELLFSPTGRAALEGELLTLEDILSHRVDSKQLALILTSQSLFALKQKFLTIPQLQQLKGLERLTWTHLIAIRMGFDFSAIFNGNEFSEKALNCVLGKNSVIPPTQIIYTKDDSNDLYENENNIKAAIALEACSLLSRTGNIDDFTQQIKDNLNKINLLNDFQGYYFASIAPKYDSYQITEIKIKLLEEIFQQITKKLNGLDRVYSPQQLNHIQELKNIHLTLIKEYLQNPALDINLINKLEAIVNTSGIGSKNSLLNFKQANPPRFFQPNDPFGALKEVKKIIEKAKTKFTPVPRI